jgi:undecaprenyl diphosphate synthase
MTQEFVSPIIPMHVAIVPDGNRRWARRRGLKPWQGHEEGAKMIENISRAALRLGVKYITFWGSSVDNLTRRPFEEKRELLKIYEKYFKRLIEGEDVYKNKTRIGVFGRWEEQFPGKLKRILKEGIDKTRQHADNFMNFLLAYNGDDELLSAMQSIVSKGVNQGKKDIMAEEEFRAHLMTGTLPDVDLLIRTGVEGDPHNSAGFLMWHTRNSQYYFSEKMFPDFNELEFEKAIQDFARRSRRFGK